MKTILTALLIGLSCSAFSDYSSQYEITKISGRFSTYMGSKPLILSAELKTETPTTYSEAISIFGPAFISRFSSACFWEWHFDDGTMFSTPPAEDLSTKIKLKLRKSNYTETKEPNQKLDPTVKTPVESGKTQGTAGQL